MFSSSLLAAQVTRFLQILVGCLTKCGNRRRASTLLSSALLSFALSHKKARAGAVDQLKSPLKCLVLALLPVIKNRKQHMGRKLHYIPLPFSVEEQVKAPSKLAAH